MLLSDLWKLTWSFWQIENNKSALLPSVSRGYRADRGPLAVLRLASQLVQNLSLVMSLGGIRGVWLQHLNLPAAPSLHPKYLTDSQGTAGDSGNGGPHSRLCSPQFVNKWIEHMALQFLSFFQIKVYEGEKFQISFKVISLRSCRKWKERNAQSVCACFFFLLLFFWCFWYESVRAQAFIRNALHKNHNKHSDWIIHRPWFARPSAKSEFIFFLFRLIRALEGSGMSQGMFWTLSGIIGSNT